MIRVKKIGKDGLEHEYLQFTDEEIEMNKKKYEEEKKRKPNKKQNNVLT